MKRGFTTGTAAAAAAKGAAFGLLTGVLPESVTIGLPAGSRKYGLTEGLTGSLTGDPKCGLTGASRDGLTDGLTGGFICLPVRTPSYMQQAGRPTSGSPVCGNPSSVRPPYDSPASCSPAPSEFYGSVIKDAGDDPDATHGMEITVRVSFLPESREIIIRGGYGVGLVTKGGLQVPPGEHAINPVPRKMIECSVREVIPEGGVEVEVIVPEGIERAKKTFNPRLGIEGGISILGTTGIVVPMSVDAIKATIFCEIDVCRFEKSDCLYMAPGKIGEKSLKELTGVPRVVQFSNFPGAALEHGTRAGFRRVVIGGHPGKLTKLLMGYFDTHSKDSPQAHRFVSDFLGLDGNFNTVEEIIQRLRPNARLLKSSFSALASAIAEKIVRTYPLESVEIYLFAMDGGLIGEGKHTF
ncbi:MAG: cobalamin biosynthesis protein CbiD [Nitrospirae bacterium]|nr:cobalamin biosynthesis protein CbiD [Nitrospirota bacterium]